MLDKHLADLYEVETNVLFTKVEGTCHMRLPKMK
jgi:hypothetical protein